MKTKLSPWFAGIGKLVVLFFPLIFCFSHAQAQIEVTAPDNHVYIGPYFGIPPTYTLKVKGDAYITCDTAVGGIFFQNYPNTVGTGGTLVNDPIILPQHNDGMWVGNNATRLHRLYSNGVYYGYLGLNSVSDERLKENIVQTENSRELLKTLLAVNTYTYDYTDSLLTDDMAPHRREMAYQKGLNQFGFIAQDLEKVYPYAVGQDDTDGMYTVDYLKMIPLLVEAVKAQQAEIEALKQLLEEK